MKKTGQNIHVDYLILGGGSAACVLACRLSENPILEIALLEAGGQGTDMLVRAPAAISITVPSQPLKFHNWKYKTTPQQGLNHRQGYQPRGKALGGSSAINAMLYVRGNPKDYDSWEAAGCKGWSYKDVLPYFIKSENNELGKNEFRGNQGPLHVSNQVSPRPISEIFIKACEAEHIPANPNYNGGIQDGAFLYQVTQFHSPEKKGERCSAAAAYLHPVLFRSNLHVFTKAHVCRVLFAGKKAIGAEYIQNGVTKKIFAKKEVILSAGTFGSPQILLLSGIGPKDELAKHKIIPVQLLPGVGQNLQDHVDFTLIYDVKSTDVFGIGPIGFIRLLKHIQQWAKNGSGLIASPMAEVGVFLKSNLDEDIPDIQLHFVIAKLDDHGRKLHYGYGVSCHLCVLRPKSKGTVTLQSSDPLVCPNINPQYLTHEDDMNRMVWATHKVRQIMQSAPLKAYGVKEIITQDGTSDHDIRELIRQRSDTIYHPVGTCKMGIDLMSVVDPEMRVYGVEGLRVIDASVMPSLIGGNTNAPTIMMAEKMAELILKNHIPH